MPGSSVSPILKQLIYGARVTSASNTGAVPLSTYFNTDLKNFGDHEFEAHWYVFVIRKADNSVTPPFGEYKLCATYTSATGYFLTDHFSSGLNVGDEIYVIHESIANTLFNSQQPTVLPSFIETWQFIDPAIWTKTNPITGAAWNNVVGLEPPGVWANSTPNSSEFSRLVTRDYWQVGPGSYGPGTYGAKSIHQGFYIEFELMLSSLAALANVDGAHTFYGFSLPGDDRSSNNLIGIIIDPVLDFIFAFQDIGGVETVDNIDSAISLVAPNFCKIRIESSPRLLKFYVNDVQRDQIISTSLAATNGQAVVNFNHAANAGGASPIRIGQIAMGYLPGSS